MKIILAATPMPSHVDALLTAGRLLRAAGHEVVLQTAAAYRTRAAAAGIAFHPLAPGVSPDLRNLDLALPVRRSLPQGPQQLLFDLSQIVLAPLPRQAAALLALHRQFEADLVLHDTLYGGALPLLMNGQAGRPVVACLGSTVLPLARDDGAVTGLGLPPATSAAQRALYDIIGQDLAATFHAPLQARANALLAGIGCPALPCPLLDALLRLPDLYLQPSVPGFEFPRAALPRSLHFIGALPPVAEDDVPGALAMALARGQRVVLISQNCWREPDLSRLIWPASDALAHRHDLQLLVATRGMPLTRETAALPANVHLVPASAVAAILPHADLLLSNGGFGVVTQALCHGVPVVCAGLGEGKPEVAARVAWSGAGLNLLSDRPSPLQLREAVDEVLDRPAYRGRAQDLAYEFERYDAARVLPMLVESAVRRRQGRLAA